MNLTSEFYKVSKLTSIASEKPRQEQSKSVQQCNSD